jgi:hypothetical protein
MFYLHLYFKLFSYTLLSFTSFQSYFFSTISDKISRIFRYGEKLLKTMEKLVYRIIG